MTLNTKILRLSILPLLVGGLVGCKLLTNLGLALPDQSSPVTAIGDLKTEQSVGATVYLQGKVLSQAPFLGSGAYQLQDSSGSVWVITYQTLPQAGKEVLIEGKVEYQSIPVGGQDLGELYILEVKQLDSLAQIPIAEPVKPVVESAPPSPTPVETEAPAKPAKKPVDDLLFPHKENNK